MGVDQRKRDEFKEEIVGNLKPWVKYDHVKNEYGKFVFEPLERGMGVTIGNAMRRVMLSSLGGFAITSLWIEGVKHEFSTIENVTQDVIDIIANLKSVVLKKDTKETIEVSYESKGKKDIFAKDLFEGTEITLITKDQLIMTCTEGANIKFKVEVEYGIGYKLADTNVVGKPLETIMIDADFTPIKRINHKVSKMRVGKSLDYDSLTLEIWGDSSISPDDAVQTASKILNERFSSFYILNNNPKEEELKLIEEEEKKKTKELDVSIEELDFSARTINALKRAKILTLKQLVESKWSELEDIKNFGAKCKEEVKEKIEQYGVVMQP